MARRQSVGCVSEETLPVVWKRFAQHHTDDGGHRPCRWPPCSFSSECGSRKGLGIGRRGTSGFSVAGARVDVRDVHRARRTMAVSAGAARPDAVQHGISNHGDRFCRIGGAAGAGRRGDSAVSARAARGTERDGGVCDDRGRAHPRSRRGAAVDGGVSDLVRPGPRVARFGGVPGDSIRRVGDGAGRRRHAGGDVLHGRPPGAAARVGVEGRGNPAGAHRRR